MDEENADPAYEGYVSTSSSSLSLHTIPDDDDENVGLEVETFRPEELSRLDRAALTNDVEEVKKLMAKNWNVNNNDSRGNTCVHYAASANSCEALEEIVKSDDLRVDLKNFHGETPYHICLSNDPEVKTLDILFKSGFPLNATNNMGLSPLELFFGANVPPLAKTVEVIKWVAEHDVGLVSRFCLNQIIRTYKDECLEIFYVLYYYGLDLNRLQYSPFDELYEHPFITAWNYCREPVIEFLFDFVDFNAESPNGKTVFTKSMELRRVVYDDKRSWYMDMIKQGANINFKSCLSLSCWTNTETYEYIWKNCDRDWSLRSDSEFFIRLICNDTFPVRDYLNFVYEVLGSDHMQLIVSNPFNDITICDILIEALVSLKGKMDQSERAKIIFAALTYENRISFQCLRKYYLAFNFDEGFQAFLKITVFIKSLPVDNNKLKHICLPQLEFEVVDMEVHSLTVLCRNAVRRHLRRPKDNVYFGYYNEVQKLDVPQVVKDIICLKVVV